jgi:hypothetical protein
VKHTQLYSGSDILHSNNGDFLRFTLAMSTFKFSSITEKDWPEWSIDKASASLVTVDGLHIQRVFQKIQRQLETLRSLCAEQGEEIQTYTEKSAQYDFALEKIEILEKEIEQNKSEIRKQGKEMELMKYQHNELDAKVALQNEYIEKIHKVIDQQTRAIRSLERQTKESKLKSESFGSIPNLLPKDDQLIHDSVSLDNSLKYSPFLKGEQSGISSSKPILKNMQSQTDFPSSDPTFEIHDFDEMEAIPLESSLQSLESPSSFSQQELQLNAEEIPQPTVSVISPHDSSQQSRHPSISVSQNTQPQDLGMGIDPETSILTSSVQQLGSQLEDQGDDRTEAASTASQFMRSSTNIEMNSNRSLLNPTLHLTIHTTAVNPPSSAASTSTAPAATVPAPVPEAPISSSITRPHSAAPSITFSSSVHRYDVLATRLNSLTEELQNSQVNTTEELKLMKAKWNKKFHEMHDWILNYINQQHRNSNQGLDHTSADSLISPLMPSLVDQSLTSQQQSQSQRQQQQQQEQSQSQRQQQQQQEQSQEHHFSELGTISLFQCPECYRLSKAALAEEGMNIPLRSSICHEHKQPQKSNSKRNKSMMMSTSKTTVGDLPLAVNRSGDRHKHRIDLRTATGTSHSHSTHSQLWWNMVPK